MVDGSTQNRYINCISEALEAAPDHPPHFSTTMTTIQSTEFRSFPPADDLIQFLSSIDYKGIAERIITITIWTAAIFMVVGTKLINSIATFWELHGDDVITKANRAVDYAYMGAAVTYNMGKNVGERYYSFRDLFIQATA